MLTEQLINEVVLCCGRASERIALWQAGRQSGTRLKMSRLTQFIGIALLLAGCSRPGPDVVRIAPTVAGQETTTRGGTDHLVRWLQRRSDFEIHHQGAAGKVKVEFRVATYRAERHVWLEQEGQPLPTRELVTKTFWENGDVLISNTVTLKSGINHFSIVTDGNAVDVTPGRPVFLLLVGGIDVTRPPNP